VLYFQQPGIAETELGRDVGRSLRGFFGDTRPPGQILHSGSLPQCSGPGGGWTARSAHWRAQGTYVIAVLVPSARNRKTALILSWAAGSKRFPV
jgi:hypothetical protein